MFWLALRPNRCHKTLHISTFTFHHCLIQLINALIIIKIQLEIKHHVANIFLHILIQHLHNYACIGSSIFLRTKCFFRVSILTNSFLIRCLLNQFKTVLFNSSESYTKEKHTSYERSVMWC